MVSIVIFERYLFYFLFFAPNAPLYEMLGEVNELKTSNSGVLLFFGLYYIIIGCVTGMHFATHSIEHATKKQTRLKGRFLIMAFLLFAIQITMEALIPPSMIFLVLMARILLVLSTFLWYLGFTTPKWIKKYLSLEEESAEE